MSSLNSTFHSHTTAATTNSNGDSSSFRHFFRRLLQPCEVNPKASVDKAWALAIILKVLMVLTALILSKCDPFRILPFLFHWKFG